MQDPTEGIVLPAELLEAIERARPGIPIERAVEHAVRTQLTCRHDQLRCAQCDRGAPAGWWFDRELRRRRWHNRVLSDFYAEVHEAVAAVARSAVDNSAGQAAQAVHEVARRHRLRAAKHLAPPAVMTRAEHVDLALGRFYRQVIAALGDHAQQRAATANGAPLVVKRVALAAGVTAVEDVPMPRLTRALLEERRRATSRWAEPKLDSELGERDAELVAAIDQQLRATAVTTFRPSLLCPRPDDHEEAPLAAIGRLEECGHGAFATATQLNQDGYHPPRGETAWTSRIVKELRGGRARGVVGRPAGADEDLPMLRYVDVVEALGATGDRDAWLRLGRRLHARPGWRFIVNESGLLLWVHARLNLWASAGGGKAPHLSVWRGGRHVDDAAAWDFADVEELVAELDRQEAGRARFATRTWGSGRWATEPAALALVSG